MLTHVHVCSSSTPSPSSLLIFQSVLLHGRSGGGRRSVQLSVVALINTDFIKASVPLSLLIITDFLIEKADCRSVSI
jgi:hypothetical protein